LIDVDALDLLHIHLDRMAPDQSALEDDATIGDRDFGRPATKPRA